MADNKDKKVLNVPALRFPEFTDEWIFAPLYDYLEVNRERNRNDEFDKGAVLSVSGDYGIVNQIQLLGRSFAGSSVKDYHVVRKGNIVYTKSPLKEYPYGIVKVNKGNEGIVSTLYAVYNVKHNAVGGFIESYFALPKRTNRYFKPIVRIGAKHDMKIGNEEAIANIVCFPSHAEQRKIAAFLSLLDQRISIQNKIIEKLETLIKGIVELAFSHATTSNTLGYYITQISQRNKTGKDLPVLSVSNKHGFVEQSEQFEDRIIASDDTSNYKIVNINDFAYNPARINVGSIARLKDKECGIVSPMYICFHTSKDILPEYLELFFKTVTFSFGVWKRLEGSVRLCLSYESLCEVVIPVISIREQQSLVKIITTFYSKLDVEKDFLRSYQSQKQYLLLQMFI